MKRLPLTVALALAIHLSQRPKEGTMQEEQKQDTSTGDDVRHAAENPPVAPAPSIGRMVWYYPWPTDTRPRSPGQAHSAQVVCVHSHGCVNLAIYDANGEHYARCSVSLYHPDAVPEWQVAAGGYATWMPYQVK